MTRGQAKVVQLRLDSHAPDVSQVKFPKIDTRRRAQKFLEQFLSLAERTLISEEVINVPNLRGRLEKRDHQETSHINQYWTCSPLHMNR